MRLLGCHSIVEDWVIGEFWKEELSFNSHSVVED